MMYTVMPMEAIFPQAETLPALKECAHNGVNLLVEELPSGQRRIERIISTNPMDYLNPALQPGQLM